jgi:hypothetical protein
MPTGTPQRIDKAYSWDAPLAAHGMMHMVITNAAKGDPYGSTCCSCTWPTWLELGDERAGDDAC